MKNYGGFRLRWIEANSAIDNSEKDEFERVLIQCFSRKMKHRPIPSKAELYSQQINIITRRQRDEGTHANVWPQILRRKFSFKTVV
jgi:hypothetical protein